MSKLGMRRVTVLALIALCAILPLLWGGWYVMNKHAWAEGKLAELEPRYARLLGLEGQSSDLAAALAQAVAAREKFVYPAALDEAQTGNNAQQKVRDTLAAAGLQIISSQVLASKEGKGFDRIPLVVRAEGDMLGIQSALAVMGGLQPAILIDDISIQSLSALQVASPKLAPRLTVQLSLSVLRERP
jgi:general secretion pathway protein M